VGGDIGEEGQQLVLKFVELVTSDGDKGVEEEASRWGGYVLVEERRRRREYILFWEKCVLDCEGRVIDVDLVS